MLALTVAGYLVIRARGERLVAPDPEHALVHVGVLHETTLAKVLLALAVITLLARLVGGAFQRFLKQPPVVGEILAGLLLGPSFLGAISPAAQDWLLPSSAAPFLGIVAKVGVVLFMFLVGLELDTRLLRRTGHATLTVSHASIVAPFLLGAALALALYPLYSTSNVSFTVFSLFLGASMSVTAFPVLARILTDQGAQRTALGATALACAAVDDVTAWTLLAFVAGVASAQVGGALWTLILGIAYVGAMLLVVRPIAGWFAAREEQSEGPVSHAALSLVYGALLLSSVATESIGIHALFGAFLLGVLLPHEGRLASGVRERTEDLVIVLLLPAFFAFTGMRTQIGLVDGWRDWAFCGAIIAVATLGKFGGSYVAARIAGMRPREASAIGILMNTRGLMELVVLNVGLDMGVLSPTLFTMLVIMALVTTFTTTPVLALLLGKRGFGEEPPINGPIAPRVAEGHG